MAEKTDPKPQKASPFDIMMPVESEPPIAGRRAGARLTRSHLETIVWVSEARSIHGAAQRYGDHQPLLSKRLSEAEHILGTELFIRSRSGCIPRPEAKNLIGRAARVLRDLQALESPNESGPRKIRLGCIPRVLHTLFPAFLAVAAKEEDPIVVQAIELSSSELFQDLLRGKLDAVIGQLTDFANEDGLVSVPLYEEVTVFVADIDNPQVRGSMSVEKLIENPMILPAYTTSTRRAFERLVLNERLEPPAPIVETKSFASSLALLRGSPCIALVPEPVALRYEAAKLVKRVKVNRQLDPVGICLFYRFDQTLDPAMRQVEALVRKTLKLSTNSPNPRRRSNADRLRR
jgi:DNA-binding transcriptional LysR family regulator